MSSLVLPSQSLAFQNILIPVLAPAYNEEVTIVDSVKSLLNMNYTNFEIIVINDGSKDSTLQTVIDAFSLHKISFPVHNKGAQ